MLEGLIQEAGSAQWPDRLPAFEALLLLFGSDPDRFGWIIDRLAEPQVPDALAVAFAARLPARRRGTDAAALRLLGPRLDSGEPSRAKTAVQVLRAGGRARVLADPACRCAFGLAPAEPVPGAPAWLLAFPLGDGTLRWRPEADGAWPGWVLNVEPAAPGEGEGILVRRIDPAPEAPWRVLPRAGEPGLDVGGSPAR
jgi:hypothetical protein